MPFPVVVFLVGQGRSDTPLGGARVGAGRKHFAEHRDAGTLSDFDGRPQPRQTGSNNNGVKLMLHNSPHLYPG